MSDFQTTFTPSTSLKWVGFSFMSLLLHPHFSFTFSFAFSFYCFFFPQLPTLFPPGKGPFASLARVLTSTNFIYCPQSHAYMSPSLKSGGPFLFLLPSSPHHCAGWVSFFYLHFIWVSLFKDRVVAMWKPHCNSSI